MPSGLYLVGRGSTTNHTILTMPSSYNGKKLKSVVIFFGVGGVMELYRGVNTVPAGSNFNTSGNVTLITGTTHDYFIFGIL